MINYEKKYRKQKFREAVTILPRRGDGLHVAILGAANLGVAAGLSEDAIIEAISAADRDFKPNEVEEAVDKAIADADAQAEDTLRGRGLRVPASKAAAAGRILSVDKDRAARLQATLIEKGGGIVDPFDPEVRDASNPRFELVPAIAGMEGSEHRRDMQTFLCSVFQSTDIVYIGNGMEAKYYQRDHVKTVATWADFFGRELDAIDNEPDSQEQQRMLADLGNRYPFFVINPLTGTPDENGSLRSNASVKDPRHLLLESDSLSLEQQIALMRGLKLPVVSMTFSGSKSIHALVDVAQIPGGESVRDLTSWNETVKRDFFGQLGPLGFDKATSNPARLSRLPGMFRPDRGTFQQLLYLSRSGERLHG